MGTVESPQICSWCKEPVTDSVLASTAMHRECVVRQVLGSVACQKKLCKKHGGPGCGDDPKLPRRVAAYAAFRYALAVQTIGQIHNS